LKLLQGLKCLLKDQLFNVFKHIFIVTVWTEFGLTQEKTRKIGAEKFGAVLEVP